MVSYIKQESSNMSIENIQAKEPEYKQFYPQKIRYPLD